MKLIASLKSAAWLAVCALTVVCALPEAHAHGMKIGDLYIEHPYATPSRPGLNTGAVYFKSIKNDGAQADQLLSASTPAAASVELHQMQMEGEVMRMKEVSAVDLPAHAEVRMRHGAASGYHLMLMGLKAPLKDGDRFPVVLNFKRAGEREVMVWVQTPRDAGTEHMH